MYIYLATLNCRRYYPIINYNILLQSVCAYVCMHLFVFQPITQGDITGYQVYYNGTMMNVTSSTTTLTFTAPSLPDGVFTGTVVVMMTAISRYGVGSPSNPVAAIIGMQLVRAVYVVIYTYSNNVCISYSYIFIRVYSYVYELKNYILNR